MIKHITFLALLLGWSWSSMAQTTEVPAAELSSTPPALAPSIIPPAPAETIEIENTKTTRKISYGLSAGTQFSRVLGTATYLEPSIMFPVTKRFSVFASLNLITTFGANPMMFGGSDLRPNYAPMRNQRFILNAGGNYLVNDRLNLTGSVWRDFSKNALPAQVNLLMPGGSNGMSLRANYKVTDNLSVSGGLRFSNGNAYNNMWYNPGLPFGY